MSARAIPEGACDAHCHIIGPHDRYAPAPFAGDVPDGNAHAHKLALRGAGLSRALIVHPSSVYGADHTAMMDALAASPGMYRGVAVADRFVADSQLEAWRDAGVCALRFIEVKTAAGQRFPGSAGFEDMRELAPRLRALGMHMQLWAPCEDIVANEKMLVSLGVPVVLDHMGKIDAARGVGDAGFQRLRALVRDGALWVKLSLCRNSQRFPDYEDLRAFHDAFIEANPARLVWGSDWPHLRMGALTPDIGHLLDLFLTWTNDEALARRILVDNPAGLFGFAQTKEA
ncbi:MAG: putative metal-dependent hydrolase, TIM-barrel fold [Hyphomicrobiales bacterium]|nr:putative metal-dependent hydrolase, TIM-barrel fold [Hyphomicrobiales bacterium]